MNLTEIVQTIVLNNQYKKCNYNPFRYKAEGLLFIRGEKTMTYRMYWGLPILILLIGTTAVFIVMHEIVEHREVQKEITEAQELADRIKARKISENNQHSEVPTDIPRKPIELREVPAENPIQPIVPHEVQKKNGQDTDILSSEEVKALYHMLDTEGFIPDKLSEKQLLYLSKVGLHWDYLSQEQANEAERETFAKHGLNPPPEGWKYSFQSAWVPALDENGDAIIYKVGNSDIEKSFGGFLLDDSE